MNGMDAQVERYRRDGYLFLPGFFSRGEAARWRGALPEVFAQDTPGRVMEAGSGVVRSVYGTHAHHPLFAGMARDPRLVELARAVLESHVYVHQFKINAKQAFGGEVWEWHQDYIFWRNEDGMPENRVLNVVVFLDEVNEFNGPLLIIPGSHRHGVIASEQRDDVEDGDENAPAWKSNVSARLTYAITRDDVARLVGESGIVGPRGPAGSVLLFDANVVHGSSPNMSPFDRAVAIVTYNSVLNTPNPVATPRPEFLASRDYTPIVPLGEAEIDVASRDAEPVGA
ncbi:MAG TPA: phytanoyl-CoA dioxygenase family protein [Longimicrobium sp.]|nr:phytanoyl-CoA dioxygenase family protein [Longimicrobium sp.]